MNAEEYREHAKKVVDFTVDYLENIRDYKVYPTDKKPGYLRDLIPDHAPLEGEDWEDIFKDVKEKIIPGLTHWQSPHMHAYFPALTCYPAMLGDILSNAFNAIGFTWAASPVNTELEVISMNWLGKMIGLPDSFLHLDNNSVGGGVIQTTASEATLTCLLAGRARMFKKYEKKVAKFDPAEINVKLVAYCSDQAHSSVEKAGLIGLVKMRLLETDDNLSLRGETLLKAIKEDRENGLIPFWVCATLGTTGTCAFDNLDEIGTVCAEEKLWLHVDAAYAGSAFVCPEHRTWLKGIEKADSIAFNPSKWLMVHFDCTAMWVKDGKAIHSSFVVNPLYLQHANSGLAVDYMHWQIGLSRRFRALKLWFVLRNYGITGLQRHIRQNVSLAQRFEAMVLSDSRFEIPATRYLGLVVFRLKGDNALTEELLKRTNSRGNVHCVPASLPNEMYVIRFTVTSQNTTIEDLEEDWQEFTIVATEILHEVDNPTDENKARVSLKDTKNTSFGTSLLLANTPRSPKVINGSFAALLNHSDILASFAMLKAQVHNSPHMRRRIKGILMSGKQFSLDSRLDLFMGMGANPEGESVVASSTTQPPLLEDSFDECEDENVICKRANRKQTRFRSEPSTIFEEAPLCTNCGHAMTRDLQKFEN